MPRTATEWPDAPTRIGRHDAAPATDEPRLPPDLWRLAGDDARVAELHRLLGEFCHDFRNRLNSLQLYLYLAGQGPGAPAARIEDLQATYRDLLALIERLQVVCRPIRLDTLDLPLGLVVEDRAGDWARRAEARGLSLEMRPPAEEVSGPIDPSRLSQALDELATWRLAAAAPGTRLTVAWRAVGDRLAVEWSESGDAPEDAARDDRGVLPLAIAARVAAAHGGRMELASTRPLRLCLSWPAAVPAASERACRATPA